MVRLKDANRFYHGMFIENFNSTMVRLKESEVKKWLRIANLFQFHYGTIKSEKLQPMGRDRNEFQFHYGTIKSQIQTLHY